MIDEYDLALETARRRFAETTTDGSSSFRALVATLSARLA
jgi:hypothetical protein